MKKLSIILLLLLLFPSSVRAAKTVGVLLFSEEPRYGDAFRGIRDALAAGGYREPSVVFDVRSAGGSKAVAAKIVREFHRKGVDMVVTLGTNATVAARRELEKIPILFSMVFDPVEAGITRGWSRPGTNATGTSPKVDMKSIVEILHRFGVKRLLVLYTPGEKNSEIQLRELSDAADRSVVVEPLMIRRSDEITTLLPPLLSRVDGVYVTGSSVVVRSIDRVVSATVTHRRLTVTHLKDLVELGVAVGIAADPYRLGFRAGEKGVRILSGHPPAGIPVDWDRSPDLYVNDDTLGRIGKPLPADIPAAIQHIHAR